MDIGVLICFVIIVIIVFQLGKFILYNYFLFIKFWNDDLHGAKSNINFFVQPLDFFIVFLELRRDFVRVRLPAISFPWPVLLQVGQIGFPPAGYGRFTAAGPL